MITTSGDELPPAGTDPTIKETKVSMTRPQWKTSIITDRFSDVPDYNPSMSAFPGQGEGGKIAHTWLDEGQIYWSEQIATKLRESELVASSKPVKPNVSAISSSYSDVMAAAQHKGTTDAVSELIYGFVDDIGEEVDYEELGKNRQYNIQSSSYANFNFSFEKLNEETDQDDIPHLRTYV